MCIKSGIQYNASIWEPEMINWVDKYLKFYKIGSGELTNLPLIEHVAKKGKPMILTDMMHFLKVVQVPQRVSVDLEAFPIYLKISLVTLVEDHKGRESKEDKILNTKSKLT